MAARLTVVLGAYNGERFISEQLASIAGQTRPPDRLIVCDDGSTDSTVEICQGFARSVGFTTDLVRGDENVGFIANFERGLERVGAEGIVVLSDQDDVWRPDRLEQTESAFASSPAAGLVFSDAELVDERLQPLSTTLWKSVGFTPRVRAAVAAGQLFETLLAGSLVTGATMAFRAAYLPLLLPLGRAIGHDAWIALILSAVAPVVAIPEPLVSYRQHGANQIGAVRPSIVARARMDRDARLEGLRAWHDLHLQVLERLENAQDHAVPSARLDRLRESVSHLAARCTLPTERVRRTMPVMRELITGRYTRLSGGLPAAVRDVLS